MAEARAFGEHWGRLVESAVGAHLLNTAGYRTRLYYWRRNGAEVDFVLMRGRRVVVFEVKSGARRSRVDGLKAFRRHFTAAPRDNRVTDISAHVVGQGGIPLDDFLRIPPSEWFRTDRRDPPLVRDHPVKAVPTRASGEPWLVREPAAQAARGAYATGRQAEGRSGTTGRQADVPRMPGRQGDGRPTPWTNDPEALRGVIERDDLPRPGDIVRLWSRRRLHPLAHPLLASLEERIGDRDSGRRLLGPALAELACTVRFLTPVPEPILPSDAPPVWLDCALTTYPDLASSTWARCFALRLRDWENFLPDVHRLAHVPAWRVHLPAVGVRLLRAFPVRAPAGKLPVLCDLLWATALHGDRAGLGALVERKLSAGSMTVAQRVCWLAAGAVVDPASHLDALGAYVRASERRGQQLRDLVRGPAAMPAELGDALVSAGLVPDLPRRVARQATAG